MNEIRYFGPSGLHDEGLLRYVGKVAQRALDEMAPGSTFWIGKRDHSDDETRYVTDMAGVDIGTISNPVYTQVFGQKFAATPSSRRLGEIVIAVAQKNRLPDTSLEQLKWMMFGIYSNCRAELRAGTENTFYINAPTSKYFYKMHEVTDVIEKRGLVGSSHVMFNGPESKYIATINALARWHSDHPSSAHMLAMHDVNYATDGFPIPVGVEGGSQPHIKASWRCDVDQAKGTEWMCVKGVFPYRLSCRRLDQVEPGHVVAKLFVPTYMPYACNSDLLVTLRASVKKHFQLHGYTAIDSNGFVTATYDHPTYVKEPKLD